MSPLRTKKGVVAIFALVIVLSCMSSIYGADGFDSVRCGSDIRKALLGRTMSNEKIVVLEERHKDLGLKDVGASEISDRLNVISWRICGEEYVLLEAQRCRARRAEISETLKGFARICWFVSIKWP